MMDARRDRWKVWTPVLFSLVLIAGMILGFNLRDSLRNKRYISTVIQRNDRLEDIIDLIKDRYVDTLNNNVLYNDAINGILKSLDPHTVYIPTDELQGVNEDLEGSFSGIGVEFSIVHDTVQVTNVIDNGPAAHAGLEVGDQLIKVGDSLVAGRNITSERIIAMLRGKARSNIAVAVRNTAKGTLRNATITRDAVPISSVEANVMVDDRTGYIKINMFSATTYDEFVPALKKLIDQGATQLILDLRGNPGGYLDAATSIADNFLDDNKLIVYTEGRSTHRAEYKAKAKGLFEQGRIAVLIDEGSASASEILAGAVQDWDRGIVIGRRSYGKGLVQKQYEMTDGSALRLTVARYYTPSGRSIQRSFARGRDAYQEDYEKRFENGELTGADTATNTDTTRYYTGKHRVVYGGGGIKPDVYVPYDTAHISAALLSMIYSQELKAAIWDYFIQNRAKLKFSGISDFIHSFNAQRKVTDNYIAMLDPVLRRKVLHALEKPYNADHLDLQIKAQLARFLFRDNGYYAVSVKDDDAVNKALNILNSDQYLKIISGK